MRWIVGDIHGMAEQLKTLVEGVNRSDPAAQWLFVGDYVNRGPDSKGVIEFLLKMPNARFCRGNHDDVFDLLINGQCLVEQLTHKNRAAAFKWFMEHGLAETLMSYGVHLSEMKRVLTRPSDAAVIDLVSSVPATHRAFIRNLATVIEEPDLFVVHARWDPIMPDVDPSPTTFLSVDTQLCYTATWGRFSAEEIDLPKAWQRTGYFGHTPVDSYGTRGGYDPKGGGKLAPIVGNKMVLLDTAAALSPVGRLTAYCADTGKMAQADRQGKLVTLP
jgi:serine/threonine protein phosphatase 1